MTLLWMQTCLYCSVCAISGLCAVKDPNWFNITRKPNWLCEWFPAICYFITTLMWTCNWHQHANQQEYVKSKYKSHTSTTYNVCMEHNSNNLLIAKNKITMKCHIFAETIDLQRQKFGMCVLILEGNVSSLYCSSYLAGHLGDSKQFLICVSS